MGRTKKIILSLILCIPLVAAIIIGMNTSKNPGNTKNELTKVSVTTDSGTVYEYSDDDTLSFYKNIIENGTKVSGAVPGEMSTEFTVNYTGTVNSNTYTFIMNSADTSNCVYKNLNDEYFLLSKDDAHSLLLRNEFAAAYLSDLVSTLNFSIGGNMENPLSAKIDASIFDWKYKRVDGEFASDVKDEDSNGASETIVLPQDIIFEFGFDKKPDYVQITATNGNEVVYSGAPEGFSNALTYENDTLLDMNVEVKWYEAENASSYGEATYNFDLLYDVPSTFTLVDKSLKQGEFTIIRVENGNDGEKITASSDMMEKESEVFTYNGNKYIYVPIKRDAAPGEYVINISENAGPATLKFKVTSANFKSTNESYRANVIALNTTKSKDEYNNILNDLAGKSSTECLWDGKFTNPVEGGETVCNFGTTMNITGIEEKIADGMYISGSEGATVKAANNGVVVYAGTTDYMGNAVIVDHGLGLFSYYFNMGSVECEVGDAVTSASVIGTIGTSGVTPYTNTVLYANSLNGSFINPATQIKYGVSF